MPEPSLFSFLLHLHSFQTLLSNKALWVFFLCLIGLMGWIAWCDWSYSISFCYVSSFSMGEVLLVSSDSVCGVLGWGNWVFRLVFEGEAIQRISKYKSFFFFSFQLLSSQVVNTLKRALIICISIQAPRFLTAWHRLSAFVKQHEVFGNRVNLLTQLGTFLSWPVAPVGCSQCSTMFYVPLCHYVIFPKFWEVPTSSVFLQTFFQVCMKWFLFFWISFIHLSLLFFFVENVRYRFEVREFASSGFCATIGPKLISPSLKDTREIQRWERDPVPGSRAVKNRIQMIRSPMKESIT